MSTHAIGSLVRARGREWVVQPETDDELLMVRPLGGTEDETTGILLALEGDDVAAATFPPPDPDRVGDFRSSRLLRDALRLGFRSSAGPFRSFGRISVEPRPYQLVPLLMALRLEPVRMLIADDVGIGKTIEALLIARELLDQGDIRRIGVLCAPQLAEQWQREMAERFHLDAQLVLSSTVARLERNLGPGESLFDLHPHVVVSTDYIKSDRRRHEFLRAAPELVIVDEAHTCVDAGGGTGGRGRHQRHELLEGLAADATRHLLLLTATPHSGKDAAFRSLLALLDPRLGSLPDDLSGPGRESDRRQLARHFVQRRRADLRAWMEDTPFPQRLVTEQTYELTDDYRRLFDRVVDFARETVRDAGGGGHRQRVRWWSALALLRALASSPAAAAATLRNRAQVADTDSAAEADEVGRRTVLDLTADEAAESVDVPTGGDFTEAEQERTRRRLREFARQAEALAGEGDRKLTTAVRMLRELVRDGHNPIVFCRFIPTAEYLADALRAALPKAVQVDAVTGTLPPAERELRIAVLGSHPGPRVLVATDCLSEGVNLQEHFDAVVHYDLSWNPTRHEQREGRVDRFGQPRETVRAVTYYGTDNRIDGIVLDVLLRKHEAIRRTLGVSVPVPANSNAVVEAVMEGLLVRGADPQQLRLDPVAEAERDTLFGEWEDAAERETRSRRMFAQERIKPDEVARELQAVRAAVGSGADVGRFLRDAVAALGGVAVETDGALRLDLDGTPQAVREVAGVQDRTSLVVRVDAGRRQGETAVTRTHPLVEGLASHVLDTALDGSVGTIAARCGVLRTRAVTRRTTLLLARFRFHLLVVEDGVERPLLAEDARALAFAGAPTAPEWLPDSDAEGLFDARPDANVGRDQAQGFVGQVTAAWEQLEPVVAARAQRLALELRDSHRRVRDAAQRRGVRFEVRPHLPADLLGVYVLLPAAPVVA